MEQLDYHIFDSITRRQSNKRQPSKDLVSNDGRTVNSKTIGRAITSLKLFQDKYPSH